MHDTRNSTPHLLLDPQLFNATQLESNECPDIFLYLLKTNKNKTKSIPFAYQRINFAQIVHRGWEISPSWMMMKEDKCYNVIESTAVPLPMILLSLRAGLIQDYDGQISAICRPFSSLKYEGDLQMAFQVFVKANASSVFPNICIENNVCVCEI